MTHNPPKDVVEALKKECHGAASAQCTHAQHPYKWIDDAIDHLAARGYLTNPPQPEWQPIETAPRDGTEIDLWDGNRRRPDCLYSRGFGWLDTQSRIVDAPTHWMPSPAAPKPPAGGRDA